MLSLATPVSRGNASSPQKAIIYRLSSQRPSFPRMLSLTVSQQFKGFELAIDARSAHAFDKRKATNKWGINAAASEVAKVDQDPISAANSPSEPEEKKEKLKVVVHPLKKERLVLKFIWLEKNIGLALDQVIPGHGTIPLSPYYFWPRKDAWEELKAKLESKPWISQKRMIILLNQATDIINLWQQSGGNLQ